MLILCKNKYSLIIIYTYTLNKYMRINLENMSKCSVSHVQVLNLNVREKRKWCSCRFWGRKHTHRRACQEADSLCQNSTACLCRWLDRRPSHNTCTSNIPETAQASSGHPPTPCNCSHPPALALALALLHDVQSPMNGHGFCR